MSFLIKRTRACIVLLPLFIVCQTEQTQLINPSGPSLFGETYEHLDNWHHEGIGKLFLSESNVMKLECVGGSQGGLGAQAFCCRDFPDSMVIGFDLKVLTNNGLLIAFIAMKGLEGEDIITEFPSRKGTFDEYTGADSKIRSYHVSVSRYNDQGEHTGVSN